MTPAYMTEPWFAVLQRACATHRQSHVARRLGISGGAVSQLLNGTGLYGDGRARTDRMAERVIYEFDRFACPYLSDGQGGEGAVVITSSQCRAWALRPVPTSSPREIQHWQACQQCPNRLLAMATDPPKNQKPKPQQEPSP